VPLKDRALLAALSLGAGISVCLVVLFVLPGPQPWQRLRGASVPLLIAAVAAAAVEMAFRALRLRILSRAVAGRLSWWASLRITLAGDFAAAVTPSRLGGEPARLLALSRNGLSPAEAGAVLFGEFATDLVSLGFLVALSVGLGGSKGLRSGSLWSPILILAILMAAAGAILRWPGLPDRTWYLAARYRPVSWALDRAGMREFRLAGWLSDVRGRLGKLLTKGWPWMLAGTICSLLHTSARFSILPLLMSALAVPTDLAMVILIQMAIFYGFALMPTPGGSGVPEMAFTAALSVSAPSAPVGLLLVLWRFLTFYLGGALGGLLSPGLFREKTLR
jgi:uncharacterized protein (TIRG00374 family)